MLDNFIKQRRGNMRYPDLYYIEKVFLEEVKKAYSKIFDNEKTKGHSITADVFVQNWCNTATGFDLGNSVSGQAFTQEYTTVMRLHWWELDKKTGTFEPWNFLYGVFFGERPAYFCTNPTAEFEKDLKNRRMKPQKEAWVYGDKSLNGEYDI